MFLNEYWGANTTCIQRRFIVSNCHAKRGHYYAPVTQIFRLYTVSVCKYKDIKQNDEITLEIIWHVPQWI